MKQTTSVVIAVAAVAAVVAAWRVFAGFGDAPAEVVTAKPESQVAYPPPFPDTPRLPARTQLAASEQVPAREQHKNDVDLCGFGPVNPDGIPANIETAADAAIVRAIKDLERSVDGRTQATALAMRAIVDAQNAERKVTQADPVRCAETSECDEAAAEAFARGAAPSIEALVRAATTTSDPSTYVAAMRSCRSVIPDAPPQSCSSLNNERWAQLDPQNAMPWLLIARAAKQRNDLATFQDALAHASQAEVFDRRATHYGQLLASADVREESVRAVLVTKLADAETREDPGEYYSNFTMFRIYCSKQSEPGRTEVCNDLTRVLLERSVDMLGVQVAASLWQAATPTNQWRPPPPAAARLLRAQNEVLPKQSTARLTCKGSAQTESWLRGVMTDGETRYLAQREAATR